jgi:hypothetical protein
MAGLDSEFSMTALLKRSAMLVLLAGVCAGEQGCVATSVAGAAVSVAATGVKAGAKVAGTAVGVAANGVGAVGCAATGCHHGKDSDEQR